MRFPAFAVASTLLFLATDTRAGTLIIDPPSVSFGDVAVAGGPVGTTLTITNSGSSTSVSGFSLVPGGQGFTVSAPGLPAVLSHGASLTVDITYDPADREADECIVTIVDSNGVPDTFTLSGDGVAALLQVSPSSLAFDDQPWSSGTGQTLNVTLTNFGELPIDVANLGRALGTGIHFSLGVTVGLPIGPGESASVPVTFNPTGVGTKLDQLTLSLDNDPPGSPDPTVSLSGNGIEETTGVGDPGRGDAGLVAGPSPTRGTLAVRCAIPRAGSVTVELRDVSGRVVARIRSHESAAGARSFVLRDGSDWTPASGVYFVRATLDGHALGTRRVLVLR